MNARTWATGLLAAGGLFAWRRGGPRWRHGHTQAFFQGRRTGRRARQAQHRRRHHRRARWRPRRRPRRRRGPRRRSRGLLRRLSRVLWRLRRLPRLLRRLRRLPRLLRRLPWLPRLLRRSDLRRAAPYYGYYNYSAYPYYAPYAYPYYYPTTYYDYSSAVVTPITTSPSYRIMPPADGLSVPYTGPEVAPAPKPSPLDPTFPYDGGPRRPAAAARPGPDRGADAVEDPWVDNTAGGPPGVAARHQDPGEADLPGFW